MQLILDANYALDVRKGFDIAQTCSLREAVRMINLTFQQFRWDRGINTSVIFYHWRFLAGEMKTVCGECALLQIDAVCATSGLEF